MSTSNVPYGDFEDDNQPDVQPPTKRQKVDNSNGNAPVVRLSKSQVNGENNIQEDNDSEDNDSDSDEDILQRIAEIERQGQLEVDGKVVKLETGEGEIERNSSHGNHANDSNIQNRTSSIVTNGESGTAGTSAANVNPKKKSKRGKRSQKMQRLRTLLRMEKKKLQISTGGSGVSDSNANNNLNSGPRCPIIRRELLKKRIFITNIDFSIGEETLKATFSDLSGEEYANYLKEEEREDGDSDAPSKNIKLKEVRISKDSNTEKFSGFAHISYYSIKHAQAAIEKYNGYMLGNRVLFVQHCDGKSKITIPWSAYPSSICNYVSLTDKHRYFQLPENIQLEMVEIFKQRQYQGKNISTIKDAWQKTYNGGEKLDVGLWGFKNFLSAFKTIPYFKVVRQDPLLKPIVQISNSNTLNSVTASSSSAASSTGAAGSDTTSNDKKQPETFVATKKKADVKKPIRQPKGALTFVAYLR